MDIVNMIEKIKAEVRRLMNNRDSRLVDGSYFDFEHLLSFIESLEKERENRGNFPETSSNFPKIKGWVARDSCEDAFNGCGLILHYSKPWRTGAEWSNRTIAMHLPWGMFQDLKWEDEPIEVELTIRKV